MTTLIVDNRHDNDGRGQYVQNIAYCVTNDNLYRPMSVNYGGWGFRWGDVEVIMHVVGYAVLG